MLDENWMMMNKREQTVNIEQKETCVKKSSFEGMQTIKSILFAL